MISSILICDDSNLARKQLAKSLPDDFDMEVHFASNGVEGISAIRKGIGELMFLDLNMPEMDGYQVLQAIRDEGLNSMVIVVSGDIQPEARKRVKALGAVEFIKKPIDVDHLQQVLLDYGIIDEIQKKGEHVKKAAQVDPSIAKSKTNQKVKVNQIDTNFHVDFRDCYQEITNVGMGQAADLLAKLLDVFITLPVPSVNLIEASEINMMMTVAEQDAASAVCQGFIGQGIAGEAIIFFNDVGIENIASLMKHQGDIDDRIQRELIMDVANVLTGACLKGMGEQLNIGFSQGHPMILGQHQKISDMVNQNSSRWSKTLAIEVNYKITDFNINCDLLLLFTEDSLKTLNDLVEYLVDDE